MWPTKRKVQAALSLLWLSLVSVSLADNASDDPASNQINSEGSASGKSFDPPPEFYKGGLSSETQAASGLHPSLGRLGESLNEAYSKWRNSPQERIIVGHYGGGVASHGQNHVNFETNPHNHPYPYEYNTHGGGSVGGGAGAYYSGGSSGETGGIPFDVYGTRHGAGLGHPHYNPAPAGPEYAYHYPVEAHEIATHKGQGHSDVSAKALLAKSFLIPLASAAVLGIAAALVSNPLLLQLGTVSGLGQALAGKRKRRSLRRPHLSDKW
ncbi:uncharacterized protein [Drosophila pseudoobscura]|uniref:Uncharacterized protein n=1 Tax=Drosophila pseudoobscura pseudoobscura TaxID=46245 RepID=A0A6I8ULS8_DROPS|nr:uncharacterized protein LOC4818026 [Drosophila pseudoobscura]